MGAPKQKWTPEEEAALKAGVVKYGAGRWRTILKDPEFGHVLSSRSNVDLKDKWRNIYVFTNGGGSREKVRVALKKGKHEDDTVAIFPRVQNDEIIEAKPISTDDRFLQKSGSLKMPIIRLDNLVLEAITSLKEPRGSNAASIAVYIEDQYEAPPSFNRILSEKLKDLTASGKLIKVNGRYRTAPPSAVFSEISWNSGVLALEGRQKDLSGSENVPPLEGRQKDCSRSETAPTLEGRQRGSSRSEQVLTPERKQWDSFTSEKVQVRILTPSQVDAELARIRTMTGAEAAAAAARAVAEAEAAMEEAEEAAKVAEAAEADAEAAQAFAEAATLNWKRETQLTW